MGYQPRIKSPKGAIHVYKKSYREKRKDKKSNHKPTGKPIMEEKYAATEQEISEVTLKRLHTLGNQRFGSFPFSMHFDRWLSNVTAVLSEFESYLDMGLDDQFIMERSEALSTIKLQLEHRRSKEATVDQETKNLSFWRARLKQINTEYAIMTSEIKARKKAQLRRLYSSIDDLKKEQEEIIRLKTGFFRGISKKAKEKKEIEISQKLNDKQRELETLILEFNAGQKQLQDKNDRRREPVLEQIKLFQKKIRDLDDDGSLEERWFVCEALIDAVNTFLQRKTIQPSEQSN